MIATWKTISQYQTRWLEDLTGVNVYFSFNNQTCKRENNFIGGGKTFQQNLPIFRREEKNVPNDINNVK